MIVVVVNLNGGTLTYSFLPYVAHSAGSILYDSPMERLNHASVTLFCCYC